MPDSEPLAPRALVLTAGLGTRLKPLTSVRAKAAVPVNGDALARRVIRWLCRHGLRDLVLNLHHRPETIAGLVGDGADLGARVRYSWEQPLLGSAGGPRHALPLLADDGEDFLLVNGDTLTDVDVAGLLASHRASGAAVTMALIPNPRPDKYGGVCVSVDGWVTGFTRAGSAVESYHFVGVQAAKPSAFAGLDDGVPAESVNRLYPQLIAETRRAVAAFVSNASFQDIGTPRDYLETSVALAAAEGDRLASGSGVAIDPSAVLTRTAVWDDVAIGPDVSLVDCIVCDGARIPAGARYEGCAILREGTSAPSSRDRVESGLLIAPI